MVEEEKYTLFFGPDSPFSQMHPAKFTVDGIQYNCAEQYMMYKKAVLFGDADSAQRILESHNPKEQKALGRKVSKFDMHVWNEKCRQLVEDGNTAKFSQNEDLKKELFATAGTVLAEASPNDVIWGIGYRATNPKAKMKALWRGTNWLGYTLTEVRDKLIVQEK